MKKWLTGMLCGMSLVVCSFTSEGKAAFQDLPENDYFSPYVYDLVERGQISGYPDGTFRTNAPVTRAEATQMLAKYSGRYYAMDVLYQNSVSLMEEYKDLYSEEYSIVDLGFFPDVALNKWYFNAVHSIASDGILNGYEDGTFKPDGLMTRGEVAKVVRGMVKLDATVVEDGQPFEDITGHFAENAIIELSSIGLFLGRDGRHFAPNEQVTRGELAVILYRLNAYQDMLLTGEEIPVTRSYLRYKELEEELSMPQSYQFIKGTEMTTYLENYSFVNDLDINETSNYIVKHNVNAVCPDRIKQAIYEEGILKLNMIRHDYESLQQTGESLACPAVYDASLEVLEIPSEMIPTKIAKMSVPYVTETSLHFEEIVHVQQ